MGIVMIMNNLWYTIRCAWLATLGSTKWMFKGKIIGKGQIRQSMFDLAGE
jgi:hypothetical protein